MKRRWLLCDFHIHTTISDGVLELRSLIDFYGSRVFDVISITEHLREEEASEDNIEEDGATYSLRRNTFNRYLEDLKEYCSAKGYNVVDILTDVASGLNEKRGGLKKLFEYVVNGKVDVVAISYKDRLTRFGFRYLEEFFNSHGVRIEVVFGEEPKDLQQELIEDLIAVVTSFADRLYGMRSHKKKKVVESVKQAIRDC